MNLQDLISFKDCVQVGDIGAAAINETPVYKALLHENIAHLNAFEGDARQIGKIKETYGNAVTVFQDFLFDGTRQTLYVAAEESGMTSLLKPDSKVLRFFNGFELFGKILRSEEVSTRRLDDVAGVPKIDLLKMDIQGSELSVLKNGIEKLADCVAIQLEVSFICLYENQPPFGEVDVWLRQQGFVPHRFQMLKGWSIAPTVFNGDIRNPGNQLLEADLVYIKSPFQIERFTDLQLQKLALISHYCFASVDLCVYLLRALIERSVLDPSVQLRYYEMVASS